MISLEYNFAYFAYEFSSERFTILKQPLQKIKKTQRRQNLENGWEKWKQRVYIFELRLDEKGSTDDFLNFVF